MIIVFLSGAKRHRRPDGPAPENAKKPGFSSPHAVRSALRQALYNFIAPLLFQKIMV
ncbi:MAG: hypothetical protein SPG32_00325 [Candidatus Ventricola sp.]|nr:hypothetical protein [Candidatus Ventricola sp.]